MAGGPLALAERARAHLDDNDPERALHLIEMAVEADPGDRTVRETELTIYDALADQTEGKIFDLLGWLEGRMIATRDALKAMD
jgi:alkyl sulfatase BDS1-like metallo-beta-lactamase superfamily hydrolase